MKKLGLAAIVLAFAAGALPAAAQELQYWDQVEGWDVMIDPTLGNGCLIQAAYQDGSLVRIGFDQTRDAGYITAFNANWGDIEAGAVYPIGFDLDGVSYEGEATGIYLNGAPGADIYFTNEEFLFDLAKKYTLTLYNPSGTVMAIDLAGSYAGLMAAVECQDAQG